MASLPPPGAAPNDNQYGSALSLRSSWRDAVREIEEQLASAKRPAGSSGDSPSSSSDHWDLAVVFSSHDHAAGWEELPGMLRERLGIRQLIGCSGESIVGVRREVEDGPALSVWTARLPRTRIEPVRLAFEQTPEGPVFTGWNDQLLESWPDDSTLLLLADPFSFPADFLLHRLREDHPDTRVLGGMASGASVPGENRLFAQDRAVADGAVGVLLHGRGPLRSVVSQGCRPVGVPLIVTDVERNLVRGLGGRPALDVLHELFQQLPTHEKQMMQRGLHLGVVMSEYRDHFGMGDFLVRNVLGIDPETKAVAVGDFLRRGQTVQFHLRDERSASDELRHLLHAAALEKPARAALLFTCNGRGSRLFSENHHDATRIADAFGDIPLAGLFAQGEIGPVGKQNFLHGFTASVALFD